MLLMCREAAIRKMFSNSPAGFTARILEFAIKVGGAAGQKIKKFMTGEEYAKQLGNEVISMTNRGWPGVDADKASELKEYIRTAKFSEILKSEQHKRNTDKLTYQTTSGRLCYWCLTPSCFIKRINSIPSDGMERKPKNRDDLDWVTMHMCAIYREKREAQIKENAASKRVQENRGEEPL